MKPTLQIKLGQQLTLTPQLRLAIRLLQLSALELEAGTQPGAGEQSAAGAREDEAEVDGLRAPASAGARGDRGRDAADSRRRGRGLRRGAGLPLGRRPRAGSGSGSDMDGEDRDEGRAAPQDLHDHLLLAAAPEPPERRATSRSARR